MKTPERSGRALRAWRRLGMAVVVAMAVGWGPGASSQGMATDLGPQPGVEVSASSSVGASKAVGSSASAPKPARSRLDTRGDRELIDRIIAVVNDDIITLSDLRAAAAPFEEQNPSTEQRRALHEGVLDQLVYDRLMSQQIEEAKLDAADEEVERAVADILRQNKLTRDELEAAVRGRGMSMEQYLQDIRGQLVRLKVVDLKVRGRVVVTDADIEGEYVRRFGRETPEELLRIRHIFFRHDDQPTSAQKERALEAARAARVRVVAGEAFEDVAKEVSEGPSASTGGDLGELTQSGLLPELARALEGLAVGVVSDPIETANGVHVVRIDERRAGARVKFEANRDRIYQELYQREVDRQLKAWLSEVRAESAVDLRL